MARPDEGIVSLKEARKRFFTLIKPDVSGCHIWQGSVGSQGYGVFQRGKTRPGVYERWATHRAAWLFSHGKMPKRCVLHTCDNRLCVNPDHLFLGSRADNMADMVEKARRIWNGRTPQQKHIDANLTPEQIRAIRVRPYQQRIRQLLAKEYGVDIDTIAQIRARRLWRHV